MHRFKALRGMSDHMPATSKQMRVISSTFYDVVSKYGYEEISTPIVEYTEVFQRAIGEGTDIVSKEMFSFTDQDGSSACLRPEGTAGLVRAFLNNVSSHDSSLHKYAYCGPMFRRERPQKGRYRQFHQIGVECLGGKHAHLDVEVIAMAWQLLSRLGLANDVKLHINTIGDAETRQQYHSTLTNYFAAHQSSLSTISQQRLSAGHVLRILDSKDENDIALAKNAPKLIDSASKKSADRFNQVLTGLKHLNIDYEHDHHLVRGLDYYCDTVWEFVTTRLGAQATVLAGGRYDRLSVLLGAKQPIPAIGWAAGMERLMLLLQENEKPSDKQQFQPIIAVIEARQRGSDEDVEPTSLECMHFVEQLRQRGHHVLFNHAGNMKKQLRDAVEKGASVAVMLGSREFETNTLTVKDLRSTQQHSVDFANRNYDQMGAFLHSLLKSNAK